MTEQAANHPTPLAREEHERWLIAHGEAAEDAAFMTAIEFGGLFGDVIVMDEHGRIIDDHPTYIWDHLPPDTTKRTPPQR